MLGGWLGGARIEEFSDGYRVWVEMCHGNRTSVRSRCGWKDNVKLEFGVRALGCGSV